MFPVFLSLLILKVTLVLRFRLYLEHKEIHLLPLPKLDPQDVMILIKLNFSIKDPMMMEKLGLLWVS